MMSEDLQYDQYCREEQLPAISSFKQSRKKGFKYLNFKSLSYSMKDALVNFLYNI